MTGQRTNAITIAGKTLKDRSHSSNVRRSHPSKPRIANTSIIPSNIEFAGPGFQRITIEKRVSRALFGKELLHLAFITLERYQETGVVHSGNRTDPRIAFNRLPFAIANLDAQIV